MERGFARVLGGKFHLRINPRHSAYDALVGLAFLWKQNSNTVWMERRLADGFARKVIASLPALP
jgi:hypothetical protein